MVALNAFAVDKPNQLNATNPAPAPVAAQRRATGLPNALAVTTPSNPVAPQQSGGQNLLAKGASAFARGFIGPEGVAKIEDRKFAVQQRDKAAQDAATKERLTKSLAWLEQTKQIPAAERAQWTMQNAEQIFRDTGMQPDANGRYDDGSLDQGIAAIRAQAGISPEQAEYLNLGGGAVGKVQNGNFTMEREAPVEAAKPVKLSPGDVLLGEDKDGDGKLDEIFSVPDSDPAKTVNHQRFVAEDGFVYSWNPQTNETQPVRGPNGQHMRGKESSGVTINMPGNVREGVDPVTGRPVFVGIDPKNPDAGFQPIAGAAPPSNMMGAETRAKFMALAPNAYAGISQLRELFKGNKNPLAGAGTVAELANGVPIVGGIAARAVGGQDWQDFDQAWNAIELGVHIPAGAAVSVSEAQRFLRANKPALGESKETTKNKLDNVERFYQGLEAGFLGDWSGLQRLMGSSASATAPAGKGGEAQLDAEEKAMVEELRRAGKTPAEINAILSGQ